MPPNISSVFCVLRFRPTFNPCVALSYALESNGGLNITSEPLKGIYQEMLKRTPEAS